MRAGIKKNAFTMFSAHQMGTSKMGIDPKTSVVDPVGHCWEVSTDPPLPFGSLSHCSCQPLECSKLSRQSLCLESTSGPPCRAAAQLLAVPGIVEEHL